MEPKEVNSGIPPAGRTPSGEKPKTTGKKSPPEKTFVPEEIASPKNLALEGRVALMLSDISGQRNVEIINTVLSSSGVNNLSPERRKYLNTDLSAVISKVELTNESAAVTIRNGVIYIGNVFAHASTESIKREVANAVVESVWREYQSVRGRLSDNKATERLGGYLGKIISSGFYDYRLNIIELLINPNLSGEVRKEFESVVTSDLHNPQPSASGERKSRLLALLRSRLEAVIKAYIAHSKNEKVDISHPYDDMLATVLLLNQIGIKDEEITMLYHEVIKTFPDLFNGINNQLRGMSVKKIRAKLFKLASASISQEDVTGQIKQLIESSIIWGEYFPKVTQENIDRYFIARSEDPKIGAELLNFKINIVRNTTCSNSADVVLAKYMLFGEISSLAQRIPSLSAARQEITRKFLSEIIAGALSDKLITQFEAMLLDQVHRYPQLSIEELVPFIQYQVLEGNQRQAAREQFLINYANLIRAAVGETDKNLRKQLYDKAKAYFYAINHNEIATTEELLTLKTSLENPGLTAQLVKTRLPSGFSHRFGVEARYFASLRRTQALRESYNNLVRMADRALREGNTTGYEEIWRNAANVSAEMRKIDYSDREEIMRMRNKDIPGTENLDNLGRMYALDSLSLGTYGRTRIYISELANVGIRSVSELFGAVTSFSLTIRTPVRKVFMARLRKNVIDASRSSIYIDPSNNRFWDIHSRIDEAKALLNQRRIELVKKYAGKYNVDPELVAGLILAEQRDQSIQENITDYIGGVISNTSIGLGQVTVSTARKLFPALSGRSNMSIVRMLESDDFNIEAVAKMVRYIMDEGTRLLGRAPTVREIGTRYTSSDFYTLSDWGRFVEMSHNDIMVSGIFRDSVRSGLRNTLKLNRELIQEYNP